MARQRRFNPGIWSTLTVCVLAPLFAGLGYWQLQRAGEKEGVLAQRAAAETEPVQIVRGSELPGELHLRGVVFTCQPDSARQLLLDNRVLKQQVGYEVLLPCRLSNGVVLLLNRGWVKASLNRDELPDVNIVLPDTLTVSGNFAVPGRGLSLGQAFDEGAQRWPRRIQYYDYVGIEQLLDRSVMRGVVIVAAESPLVLAYNWQPIAFGPEKHYGYAAQWSALLVLLLVLYFALNVERVNREESL